MRSEEITLKFRDMSCVNIADVYEESTNALRLIASLISYVDDMGAMNRTDLSQSLLFLLGIQQASAKQIQANLKQPLNPVNR